MYPEAMVLKVKFVKTPFEEKKNYILMKTAINGKSSVGKRQGLTEA